MSLKHTDLIVVYKSPTGKDSDLRNILERAINPQRSTLVCGDFNMCFTERKISNTILFLIESGFMQLVQDPTHIAGGHIDHVYVRGIQANIQLYSPYYTAKDHDGLLISINDGNLKEE